MIILSIMRNEFASSDLVLCLRDNYGIDGIAKLPINTTEITKATNGVPMLQVDFWRIEKFQKYFWPGESISLVIDEDTDYEKKGRSWSELEKLIDSVL